MELKPDHSVEVKQYMNLVEYTDVVSVEEPSTIRMI
jgi:hypothetical protein